MKSQIINHNHIRAVVFPEPSENIMKDTVENLELDLESIKEKEKKKIEAANKRIQDIEARKAELIAEREATDKVRKLEHIQNHQHYLQKANESVEIDEEKKFRKWAADELRQANEIFVNGFDEPAQTEIEVPKISFKENAFKWLFTHFGSWVLQIGMLLAAATFCYNQVMTQKEQIMKINTLFAHSSETTMMIAPPLDERNIQQIWFDKYRLIGDMGFALFMLLVLAPHILLTLLPFVKLPKNLWTSYQNIPETQKQWLSFAWSSLVLLVVVLSH